MNHIKTYSTTEVASLLNTSIERIQKLIRKGYLKATRIQSGQQYHYQITQAEFDRLKPTIIIDNDHESLQDFIKREQLSHNVVNKALHQLQIRPDNPKLHPNQIIKTYWYKKTDLATIKTYLKNRHQNINYLPADFLTPNTNRPYQKDRDYSIYTLTKFIDPIHPPTQRIVLQWIRYQRIPYQVDPYAKIYFDYPQAMWIKDHYQVIPQQIFGTNAQLAHQLNANPKTILSFCKAHHFNGHKILGYRELFYTKTEVAQIQTLWSHRQIHRKQV